MKTTYKKLAAVSILTTTLLAVIDVQAEIAGDAGSLSYTNRAYVNAIPGDPNPVADTTIEFAKIVYADRAFGQAIYSYPSNSAMQETDFNVEYVDTAHGQAIYSYPNNNPVKPRLTLTIEDKQNGRTIVPVILRQSRTAEQLSNP